MTNPTSPSRFQEALDAPEHQSKLKPEDNKFHVGNGGDGKHYWLTPPDLYAELDAEFKFDFDPCPYPKPDDFDGLTNEWGKSNYVNPPFGSIIHEGKKKGPTAWARKAITESNKSKDVVLVYPIDKWILMLLEAGAEVRNLKDVRWLATEDGSQGKGTGRHIAAFILRGRESLQRTIAAEKARDGVECCVPVTGEPSFVLLGRDPQAPDLVENWAKVRKQCEPGSEKVDMALDIAKRMRAYKDENPDKGMNAALYSKARDEVDLDALKQKIADLLGEKLGGNVLTCQEWAIKFTLDHLAALGMIGQKDDPFHGIPIGGHIHLMQRDKVDHPDHPWWCIIKRDNEWIGQGGGKTYVEAVQNAVSEIAAPAPSKEGRE